MIDRRTFLAASTLVTFSAGVPGILYAAKPKGQRILVVVQLTGGNDGLNTVIPYADDEYYKNRFTLAIGKNAVLTCDDHVGLHPSLQGFSDLFEDDWLAVVQGVGYPNPNRSHFSSMDIWHTARREPAARDLGWIGRSLETLPRDAVGAASQSVPALHLGRELQPRALLCETLGVPTVGSIDAFKLRAGPEAARMIRRQVEIPREEGGEVLDFLREGMAAALTSSEQVQEAMGRYKGAVPYPASELADNLRTVAQLIDAGLSTRVFYLTLGGFDTHSQQDNAHGALLRQLGDAVKAFHNDLKARGHGDRVLTLCFSEFGRRVRENATRGTDHGAAAPLFLVGNAVRAGVHGKHPSLTDLDDGDLKHHTDFRRVYAAVLENWLGLPSRDVLGGTFDPLAVIG